MWGVVICDACRNRGHPACSLSTRTVCPPSTGLGAGNGRGPVTCPPGLCPPSTGLGAGNGRDPVACPPGQCVHHLQG